MIRRLKESVGNVKLDGDRVLPAIGFVNAEKLIPAARNFSSWSNYAMYTKGTTILIGDDGEGAWDMYEFGCDPKTASDLWEEDGGGALNFGRYPSGIRTIRETVTLHYDDDPEGFRDKDVYVRVSSSVDLARILYTLLPDYFS